jgi:hypothetical protein
MGATITVQCEAEGCPFTTGIRIDPGPESWMVGAAAREVLAEHPDHDNRKRWRFLRTEDDE